MRAARPAHDARRMGRPLLHERGHVAGRRVPRRRLGLVLEQPARQPLGPGCVGRARPAATGGPLSLWSIARRDATRPRGASMREEPSHAGSQRATARVAQRKEREIALSCSRAARADTNQSSEFASPRSCEKGGRSPLCSLDETPRKPSHTSSEPTIGRGGRRRQASCGTSGCTSR